jgi:hypothetical protein
MEQLAQSASWRKEGEVESQMRAFQELSFFGHWRMPLADKDAKRPGKYSRWIKNAR